MSDITIVSFIGNGGQPTVAAGTGTSGSGLSILTSLGDLVASGADALFNGPKERRNERRQGKRTSSHLYCSGALTLQQSRLLVTVDSLPLLLALVPPALVSLPSPASVI